MTVHWRYTAPHDPVPRRCELCSEPVTSRQAYGGSPHVCLGGRVVVLSTESSLESARETGRPPLRGDGSSSTTTGSTRSRGWSVTASSGSVCRRLRRKRSGSISTPEKSQRGTDSGRTSDSSRSSSAVDATIGTAARTPADRCADGDHMWGFATDDPEDWFCVRGCGQRLPCRNFAISVTGYRIPCVVTGKHHFHEFHSA